MEDLEMLSPELPEESELVDRFCANCGALCGVCIGLKGDLKLCSECGYAELVQ